MRIFHSHSETITTLICQHPGLVLEFHLCIPELAQPKKHKATKNNFGFLCNNVHWLTQVQKIRTAGLQSEAGYQKAVTKNFALETAQLDGVCIQALGYRKIR